MTTTVSERLRSLWALQQIDSQIQRLNRARASLDNGDVAGKESRTAHDLAHQSRDTFNKLSASLKDTELKLSSVETKRQTYQHRMYEGGITNSRELSNIEKEIDALGRQRADLDGKILELMESVESAEQSTTVAENQARVSETHHLDILEQFRARYESMGLELDQAMRHRAEVAAAMDDASTLKRYDDLRSRSGGVGVARIDENSCGGCHMALSSTLIKAVREENDFTKCDNCGRYLIWIPAAH